MVGPRLDQGDHGVAMVDHDRDLADVVITRGHSHRSPNRLVPAPTMTGAAPPATVITRHYATSRTSCSDASVVSGERQAVGRVRSLNSRVNRSAACPWLTPDLA